MFIPTFFLFLQQIVEFVRRKNDFINIIKSSWGRIIILLNIYQLYSTEVTKTNRCLEILTQKQKLKLNKDHQHADNNNALFKALAGVQIDPTG